MLLEQILLPGIALPVMVAAAAQLLAWHPWRLRPPSGDWGAPLALGAGYLAAHLALNGRPRMPAVEASEWLFHLAAVATLLALLQPLWRRAGAERIELGTRLPLFAALLWLCLRPLIEHQWGRAATAAWLIGLGTALLLLGAALDRLARQATRPELVGSLFLVLSIGLALVLALSGTARIAQLCGAATAAAAVGWVLSWWRGRPALGPRSVTLATVLLGGCLMIGYFYAEVPPASALLLLAAAPAAAWLASRRAARAAGASVAAAALPILAAVTIAALSGP